MDQVDGGGHDAGVRPADRSVGDAPVAATGRSIEALEQALAEANRQLEASRRERDRFFGLSLDLMLSCRTDGVLEQVNPAFTAILGYEADEVVGGVIQDLIHPDDLESTTAELARLNQGILTFHFENRYRTKAGEYRLLEWTAAFEDGLVYAVARDITERRRVLQALTASEARYRALFEANQDAIVVADAERVIMDVNPAFTATFGYTADEAIGRSTTFLYADAEQHGQVTRALKAEGSAHATIRALPQYRRKNGETFPSELTAYFLNDETGRVVNTIGVLKDVTEQREAERRIAEHVQALQLADELKDQFLGILSHELRTPINAIMAFSSILDDEIGGPLTETQHSYTRKILSASDKLLALVSDLLDVSRMQAGKFTISPGPADLRPLLDETLASLAPEAESHGLTLTSRVQPDLPTLVADEQRVAQVISNMVSNAIKFSEPGGAVTVVAFVDGAWLRVEVQDDGIGIAPEDRARLFQRFSQLDMSNTRRA
ncbi:MAG: PAS domain S-box protein, partial [Candidatus Sericytochromatia bacterium]